MEYHYILFIIFQILLKYHNVWCGGFSPERKWFGKVCCWWKLNFYRMVWIFFRQKCQSLWWYELGCSVKIGSLTRLVHIYVMYHSCIWRHLQSKYIQNEQIKGFSVIYSEPEPTKQVLRVDLQFIERCSSSKNGSFAFPDDFI